MSQKHTARRLVAGFITASAVIFTLSACASQPQKPKGFELPPALSEVYRGGTLAPLQNADSQALGMPNQYDQVTHTCVSTPIFDLYGRYYRTEVRCW